MNQARLTRADPLTLTLVGDVVTLTNAKYELTQFNVKTFDLHFDYARAIMDIVKNNTFPKRNVLVLGFGLGGLPIALAKLRDSVSIVSVDLDQRVYTIFKSIQAWLAPYPKNKLTNIVADAHLYLKLCDEKYDIVIDDVFGSQKIMLNYGDVARVMTSQGVLFINVHEEEDVNALKPVLSALFFNVRVIDDMNEILVICWGIHQHM